MTTNSRTIRSNSVTPEPNIIGSEAETLRDVAALTTSYVYSNVINIDNARSILLFVLLDGTGITDSQMIVQFSDEAQDAWYTISHLDIAITVNPNVIPTVLELGGADNLFAIPIPNPGAQVMRVGVKANAAAGTMGIFATRGQGTGTNPMVNGS